MPRQIADPLWRRSGNSQSPYRAVHFARKRGPDQHRRLLYLTRAPGRGFSDRNQSRPESRASPWRQLRRAPVCLRSPGPGDLPAKQLPAVRPQLVRCCLFRDKLPPSVHEPARTGDPGRPTASGLCWLESRWPRAMHPRLCRSNSWPLRPARTS